MKIAIRADASTAIGTGHIFRCLSLAEKLRKEGAEVVFLTRTLAGHINTRIDAQGFRITEVPEPDDPAAYLPAIGLLDWLVVDHYGISAPWETHARPFTRHLMVLDDLADRSHDCDLLVDQNFFEDMDTRYRQLVPESATIFVGPAYALLRPEFRQLRGRLGERSGEIRRMMISLGGADPNNATRTVLDGLALLDLSGIEVDVIVGAANPQPEQIQERTEALGFRYCRNIPDMAERMAQTDLFIGAGGTTTWERMALGLPGIVVSIADNHRELSRQLAEHGCQLYLGPSETLSPESVAAAVATLRHCPETLRFMGRRGMSLVDGLGTERVCEFLLARTQNPTGTPG